MQQPLLIVSGPDGIYGTLPRAPENGAERVALTLESGAVVEVPRNQLDQRPDGSWFLNMSRRDILAKAPSSPKQTVVIPVVQEEPIISKREIATGAVRVEVHPSTRSEGLDVPLMEEEAEVQRVPVNRIVERAEAARIEGDVTIIPVYEEVAVVERRLMLKEEIHIRRRRTTRREHLSVPLRTEEVRVTRSDA
jgi:uncharacterized protein (TIGR02271 family)